MKNFGKKLAVAAVFLAVPVLAHADVTSSSLRDTRITGNLIQLPGGGVQGQTNGGGDSLFVGINVFGLDNYALLGFSIAGLPVGEIVTGGQLVIDGDTRTLPSQAGSPTDLLVVRELFDDNQGWVEGTGSISGSGFQNPDVASFVQRAFGSGAWLDDNGVPVDNFLGAFDDASQLNTNTVNGFVDVPTTAPITLTFTFNAVDGQRWLNQGYADLVIRVIDDGNLSSRFRLIEETAELTVFTEPTSPVLLGDVNLDGAVNFLDISPFIALVASGEFQAEADVDQNQSVDFLDISPFIEILSGP